MAFAVVTESMKERGDITDIEATIYTEKDNHKGIIIGKGGAMLKKSALKHEPIWNDSSVAELTFSFG